MTAISQSKERKASNVKTVQELLLKGVHGYKPALVEVIFEKIEQHLVYPMCNHKSLVTVTSIEEVNAENQCIQKEFNRKLEYWERNGKSEQKCRMKRTQSQIHGCVCYMQNCIGNSDGTGCFLCKESNGNFDRIQDNR